MPEQESKVGCIGFHCPYDGGAPVHFSFCENECQTRCLSMPLLKGLMREHTIEPDRYSVTEIFNPKQMVWLKRHKPYFIDPFYSTFALFGNAVHSLIEQHGKALGDDYVVEHKHIACVLGVSIVGKPDLYEKPSKTLYDYKTLKSYAMLKLLAGNFDDSNYQWQLNSYKWLFLPDAENLILEAFVKDWSYDLWFKEGVRPLERVVVPILDKEYFCRHITEVVAGHLDAEDTGQYPPCTEDECWLQKNPRSQNYGVRLRCRDYCEAASVCTQYQEWLRVTTNGEYNGKTKRFYPAR